MIYLFIFYLTGFDYELTESTITSHISDIVASTVKLNIKESLQGNNGFHANVYIVNGLQSEMKKTYHLINLLFSEGRLDSCYSVLTWKTLGLMLSKVVIIKFGNPS